MTDRHGPDAPSTEQVRRFDDPGALEVSTRRAGSCEVLTVAGEIDLSVAGPLRDKITQCLDTRPTVLVIDLSAVTFLSSPGLSALVDAQRAGAPDTTVRIVAAGRAVLRPMQITGLDRVLPGYPTLDAALAAD